jgi:predicted Zn-dependent peptidase
MYSKITLDNGVRIVCEKIPFVRSISIGIWVATGSRNENNINNGVSHFIEHMLFKGTSGRSAKEIAESIDNIGGQINAFTGKECTCYYTRTLDDHMNIAVDVLADMFFNSRFKDKDIDLERKVIQEEIGMYEDSPEDLVHDILSETVWNGDSLGYPILGTQECLKNIGRETITGYMDKMYTPCNTVISVVGNYQESELTDTLMRYFGGWNTRDGAAQDYNAVKFISDSRVKQKDIEQLHICMGFEGIENGDSDLYSLLAVNNIFGGGMSSRLFQKIREEMGLVYSIYSYPSSYRQTGLFTIYAGMNPENLESVAGLILDEVGTLVEKGIQPDDLEKSKEQLKGNYMLGLESTSSRMNSLGKSELLLDQVFTPEEILKKIEDINMERVHSAISRVFRAESMSFSAVGNMKKNVDINSMLRRG